MDIKTWANTPIHTTLRHLHIHTHALPQHPSTHAAFATSFTINRTHNHNYTLTFTLTLHTHTHTIIQSHNHQSRTCNIAKFAALYSQKYTFFTFASKCFTSLLLNAMPVRMGGAYMRSRLAALRNRMFNN